MLDAADDTNLYARKGEHITCINGHVICEIAHDIQKGDARNGDDFTNWQQPQPDKEKSVAEIRCTQCRGVWIRGSSTGGYQFHFSTGWR
jgi:hypothetical protein